MGQKKSPPSITSLSRFEIHFDVEPEIESQKLKSKVARISENLS